MSNVDRWLDRHQELKSETSFGDVDYIKLKDGPNVLRIVPPKEPRADFWIECEKSFSVGPNNKVITRPSYFNLPDPVEDEISKLKKLVNSEGKPDEIANKRADAMKGKKRAMMWVIARADEGKGYQLFDTNLIVLRDILAVMTDAEYGDITDAEKGTDITINYTPGTKRSFPVWGIVPKRSASPLGFPEALKEDLFEKHHVGQPSDVDYIKACLAGTEQAFIDAKKADRASAPAEAPPAESPSTPPAGDEESVIQAQLAAIRAKKAAAAAAVTAPTPPTAPAVGTDAVLLSADWWAVIDGKTVQVKGQAIQELVNQGHVTTSVMTYPEGAWTTADAAGFIAGNATPPPPPTSQVGADLEASLG